MKSLTNSDNLTGQRYETIFCIFLFALVFLYRENSLLIYPQVLYLLALLLSFNLAAGWMLRPWHGGLMTAVGVVIGNCAVITSILAYSGGSDSVFWVLYLLPIYTVCLLLNGIHLVLIVAGIIAFNALFEGMQADRIDSSLIVFNLGLKSGLFVFASAVTWKIAQRDRKNKERMDVQRAEIEQMESKIQQQQGSLFEFEKMADVEQLTSGIAHDLKNPIAVIFGTAKMLLDDDRIEVFKADVERITRAAELCSTITSNISHLVSNKDQRITPCNLNEVLDSALKIYEPMLVQSGIRVQKDYAFELPPIMADHTLLERVFLNLMSNARGAMKGGGALRLKTCQSPALPSGVSWIEAIVEDTGPGIAPDVLAKIFKPFNTTKAPGEGTGLGLYLSRQIAQKNNGRLNVENREEGGARFTLSLPCIRRTI